MPGVGQAIGTVAVLQTEQAELLQQLEVSVVARDEKGARAYRSAADARAKEIESLTNGIPLGTLSPAPAFGEGDIAFGDKPAGMQLGFATV